MKFFIVLVFILTLIGCSNPELPEGYTIVCSIDGSKYTWHSESFGGDGLSANIHNSRKSAIRGAISWEEYKKTPHEAPSSKYEWQFCIEENR